jgi:hypothetical protein
MARRTFKVQFNCDNAAFGPDDDGYMRDEIARILRDIADKVERKGLSGCWETIRDLNGNDIGAFAYKHPGVTPL